jgi:hypothetical protein
MYKKSLKSELKAAYKPLVSLVNYVESLAKYDKKTIKGLSKRVQNLEKGYETLSNSVENTARDFDKEIGGLIKRIESFEKKYKKLVKQQAKSQASENPEKGVKEYSSAQLQKMCGYKSVQTVYNRFKSNGLNPEKRKVGHKIFYQLSSQELSVLKQTRGSSASVSDDKEDWYDTKGMMKVLKISSYQTFFNRAKANKLKIKTKKDGQKVLKYLPPEIIERLNQDGRRQQLTGKDSNQTKESEIKPNMKDICYIAKELGVSRFIAKKRVDEHKIKAVKEGRKLLYDIDKIKLLKQDNEDSSESAEKKADNLEKKVVVGAKIPDEQDIPLFLKEKNKIPNSKKISPYNYTRLDTICKVRNIELKELLKLIDKLKIEIKYQTIKNVRTLYLSGDDDTKISGEILTERYKSVP